MYFDSGVFVYKGKAVQGRWRHYPYQIWTYQLDPLSEEEGVECDKIFQSGNRRKIFTV